MYQPLRAGKSLSLAVVFTCALTSFLTIPASGQTLTTLHNFCAQFPCSDGSTPYAPVVQGTDGNFYGTTSVGGDHSIGTVFKITAAGVLTTLHSFAGSDGSTPYGGVVQGSDGNFYGTTQHQGTSGRGTVFMITSAGVLTTIHNFTGADGSDAYGQLVQGSDGNFYGTTSSGGSDGGGTVYKITPSGTLTTLYNFCQQVACADGLSPYAGLIQATDGNFYGTTLGGGTNGSDGTVFKITPSGVLTTLHSFDASAGDFPYSPLVQGSDGNFYGTVSNGGPQDDGAIFKITPAGEFTTLHTFVGTDGSGPKGGLVQASDGNFYGVTSADVGTIFEITPNGTFTVLDHFNFSDGGFPFSGMIQGTDGNLYGTTSSGGTGSSGVVYSFSLIQSLLPLSVSVDGNGIVTSTDGFINCPGTCSHGYPAGSPVTLNAMPAQGWGFAGWGGGVCGGPDPSCSFLMLQETFVSAMFTQDQVFYTLSVSVAGNGTVTSTDGIINCPGTCSHDYLSGTQVTLNASPALGWSFMGWSGACSGSGSCNVTMTQNLSAMATFIVNASPVQFIAAAPCRVVDTRNPNGPFGGPAIQGNNSRSFPIPQGACGIPGGTAAYSLNVTVVPHRPLNYLTIWPTGQQQPFVSTMNSPDGRFKADAAIVPAGDQGAVSVFVTDTSDVVLDINGYFVPATQETTQFYPLTPCRVVDTRAGGMQPQGLGPPSLGDRETRDLPVLTSPCLGGINNPQAYSFNVTVVPVSGHPLNYLTVWPSDQTQPFVSTLNNPTATVVANGAIVPAAMNNGNIKVFASNATDVIMDINGYFAAAGQGGYSFYPFAPCRVLDTRDNHGQPFSGARTVNVVGSQCAPPSSARAYVFNATVVPGGFLNFLTLWPDGQTRPDASTLNAQDRLVTSNIAIIPTTNGSIDAYASQLTHLIMDISGYFAP